MSELSIGKFSHCMVAKVASPDVIRRCPPAESVACTFKRLSAALEVAPKIASIEIFRRIQLYWTVRTMSPSSFRTQARCFEVQLRSRLKRGLP